MRRFVVVLVGLFLLSITALGTAVGRLDVVGMTGDSGPGSVDAASAPPPAEPQQTEPSLLRVTTNPPVAGKVLVDGVARDEYGLAWLKIEPGPHRIAFSDLSGLAPPDPVDVTTVAGETTTVRGDYRVWGYLRVRTDPALPATIYVDGEPNNDWGMWREAAPGTHTLSFGQVAGFEPPPDAVVDVRPGATTEFVAHYRQSPGAPGADPSAFGSLRVTTSPAWPSTILVDGIPRDDWGLTWVKLAPGTHRVSFATVYGATPPPPADVAVVAGEVTVHEGPVRVHGSLRVETVPPVPGTISVDRIPRDDWGMWQSMEPGTYEVSFGPVPGYVTPPPETVKVTADALTTVTGRYSLSDAWRPVSASRSPPAREGHDLVYVDSSRRFLLFGGRTEVGLGPTGLLDDTWSYDPAADGWMERSPAERPSARTAYAMAYDARSDRTILFGGYTARGANDETWAYDATTDLWIQMHPRKPPAARYHHAMAYDARSDRVLLFGGDTGTDVSDETWSYDVDTDTWALLRPPQAPSPRRGTAMAYDAGSGRIVLFSGNADSVVDDTWSFDFEANRWSLVTTAAAPRFRFWHALAYDGAKDRVVLYGGATIFTRSPEPVDETWAFDLESAQWTLMSPSPKPPRLYGHGMSYDPVSGRTVLFGGFTSIPSPFPGGGGVVDQTWSYDLGADTWTPRSQAAPPSARWGHAMTYVPDADRIVLFGGNTLLGSSDETWSYDEAADTWTNLNPPVRPIPRYGHAMAYDVQSKRLILFGGGPLGGLFGDTWSYDVASNSWTQMQPATGPLGRRSHAMAYDGQSDRVILFGGSGPLGDTDDTWSYDVDTDTWTEMAPSARPPPRGGHAMAYDVRSDRVVLFGGFTGVAALDDTWAYDVEADAWSPKGASGPRPSARAGHAMSYDDRIDRVILFGGGDLTPEGDTWWYDLEGDTWTLRSLSVSPSPRQGAAMAYDGPSARTVLFGGVADGVRLADTWVYEAAPEP
ncbi:MAG: Kelch repeat-containing protein [Methanobacteriota archaeon]